MFLAQGRFRARASIIVVGEVVVQRSKKRAVMTVGCSDPLLAPTQLQWDTSEHDWLEGRGEKLYLVALLDDATSRLRARFVQHDSTEENLRQLRRYIEQRGRPVAVYTDKASLFQITPRAIHHRDAPAEQLTQIGRALKELNIEWIAAHTAQAKGRI
jgi:hypothetical protein